MKFSLRGKIWKYLDMTYFRIGPVAVRAFLIR